VQIIVAIVYGCLVQLVYVCSSYISRCDLFRLASDYKTGYLTVITYSFVLLGILKLFTIMSNPIQDVADFPANTYQKNLEVSAACITTMALLDHNMHQSSRHAVECWPREIWCGAL
jgi:hypothetical protein